MKLKMNLKTALALVGLLGTMLSMVVGTTMAQTVGTIGVGDITFSADSDQKLRPKENVLSAIDSSLNRELLKTRKFTVLDYSQLQKRITKQGLELQDYYSGAHSDSRYTQAGLDYILTADVTDFGLFNQKRGKSQTSVGLVDIEFKLIGVADITSDIESSVTAQVTQRVTLGDADAENQVLDNAIQKAVDQVVDQVISGLFPIRVMQISQEGEIKLNYGAGLLAPGDTVLIYPEDQEVVVDENGEVIGDAIATLQIITSERKFANAQALEGFEALRKGQQGQLLLSGG